MDAFARYNMQHGDPSHGDHATLIGNWVEERALRASTGQTRHEVHAAAPLQPAVDRIGSPPHHLPAHCLAAPAALSDVVQVLELEKIVPPRTFERTIAHSDAQQRALSLYREEFKEHSPENFTSKVGLERSHSRITLAAHCALH